MGTTLRGMLGALAALALVAGPAAAQSWPVELGANVGGAWRTASIEPSTGDKVKLGTGLMGDAQLGIRLLPMLRLRADGVFGRAPVKLGSTTQWNKVNLWSASGDLLFALRQPAAEFTKTEVLPYIAVGAGARWIQGMDTVVGIILNDTVFPGVVVGPASEQYLLEQAVVPMGLLGIGADVRLQRHLAVRLEAGDRLFKPVADRLAGHYTITTRKVAKLTHELYGTVGLNLLIGGHHAPAPVAVVAPPPPPPPPPAPVAQTPPPPPPPPQEQPVSVCVVDPATGMADVSATFLPTSGDTVVTTSGARQSIRDAFSDRPALAGQTWYQKGEPLTFGSGRRNVRFMPYGTARTFRASEATYLGTVGGLPVFGDPGESGALATSLGKLPAATRADLGKAAVQRPAILKQIGALKTVYVPSRSAGCVLQPLQLQELVRKVRG